jgi:uncharacterized protein YggE
MKPVRIAALAALVLAAAALAGVARPEPASSAEDEAAAGLTVTGTGSVRTVPDRAQFAFGVETQAATARAALAANTAAAGRLLAALRTAGIAAADLQTAQVSLSPRTNEQGTEIVGYSASNTVTATIRDLARIGGLVDAAVDAGANSISGPSLTRADATAQYRQALRAAFGDAREKAEALAAASGRSVGRVTAIVEGGGVTPLPAADAARSSVEIAPGTQTIEASVSVTFELTG